MRTYLNFQVPSRSLTSHNIHMIESATVSNYALYGDMSHRFMLALAECAPRVMPYSIDEAFLDLTGIDSVVSYLDFGHHVKELVRIWTGLPICVGIAPSPTLAKLANHAAKHYPATRGVVDLTDRDRQRRLMHRKRR